MKRKINRQIVDANGYKKSNEKNFTDYKVIPSNDITMDDVKSTILGIMLDKTGKPQGFEFMEPGNDYKFPNSEAVVEIPKYQYAGKIDSNGNPVPDGNYFDFANTPYQTPIDPSMQQAVRQGMGNEWMTQNTSASPNFNPAYNNQRHPSEAPNLGDVPAAYQPWSDSQYASTQNNAITEGDINAYNPNDEISPEQKAAGMGDYQFFNPYAGVDIPTAAFTLGTSIEQGDTLGTVASGVKLAAGLGRNVFSGMGLANRQKQVMAGYKEKQRDYVTGANRPQYYQEGGKMEKALTGEYLFGMDDMNPMMKPNAEIETGEYVQHPDNEIQKAVGNTHEKGGMDVALEEGTRILSDHLKLGGTHAKHFRDKYDLELKATDTFAKVLDKFNKKSGLKKIVDEQEEVIKEIKKQQEDTKDEAAFGLNMQYLSGKMKELEDKKKPLEEARKVLFEDVYTMQEKSKPKSERDEDIYAEGGEINSLAKKYGLSPDRAKELLEEYKKGGTLPQYQDGSDISRFYKPLDVNTGSFGRQKFTRDTTLSVDPQEALRRLKMQQQSLPNLMQRSGVGVTDATGIIDATTNPDAINRFQVGYNVYLDNATNAINTNPNISAEQKQALLTRLQQEKFGNGTAKDFDSIYGDFTSSRSGVALPALNEDDRKLYGDKIQRIGDVVNPDGSIKPGFENLSRPAKDYIQSVVKQGGESTFDIGLLDIPVATPVEANSSPADTPVSTGAVQPQQAADAYTMGVFLLPEQNPLPPTGLQPHLKINRRFDRIDPALISPEANLEEIRRQEAAATDQIDMLPDSQRRAALANLNANSQQNINKAVSETARINSQIQMNADVQNAQTQRIEENAGANDALSYEQRQLTAVAKTQNDYANYYNTLQANNVRNFNTINDLNLVNAMYDNFDYTPNGIVNNNDTTFYNPVNIPKKEVQKKSKKKFGGRFTK